ncbi:hypothetical protein [Flammeovirga sp. SJP92]|uniref:hypothetical protein n=1 Tax=Flammeovirga sp. SJP92 TaxID=1775430 RepID=UPI000787CDE8|nr:hypothetical protein [Flammeovirga sp. SJP92]KXX69123.1 hypothetical protein AVL50_16935 [Flammeovirga sp. SJP92]
MDIDFISEVFFPKRKGAELLFENRMEIPLIFYGDRGYHTSCCYIDWGPNFQYDGSITFNVGESYLIGHKLFNSSPQNGRLYVGKEFILGVEDDPVGFGEIIEVEKKIFKYWSLNDEVSKLKFKGFKAVDNLSSFIQRIDSFLFKSGGKLNTTHKFHPEDNCVLQTECYSEKQNLNIHEFNTLLSTYHKSWDFKSRIEPLKYEDTIQYVLWDRALKLFYSGEIKLKRKLS